MMLNWPQLFSVMHNERTDSNADLETNENNYETKQQQTMQCRGGKTGKLNTCVELILIKPMGF